MKNLFLPLSLAVLFSCSEPETKELPVLGPYKVSDSIVNGKLMTDTVYSAIRPFAFWDQDSNLITEKAVEGKVYVTDFFFTSCPTICPKMKQQMLRIYEEFQNEPRLVLLSHTIDPRHDSVATLHKFADKLGVSSDRWHFLTGNRDTIFDMAEHYMVTAMEDKLAPGGYAHSGAFLLVDTNRRVRGYYDGTKPEEVDQLIKDIRLLLP